MNLSKKSSVTGVVVGRNRRWQLPKFLAVGNLSKNILSEIFLLVGKCSFKSRKNLSMKTHLWVNLGAKLTHDDVAGSDQSLRRSMRSRWRCHSRWWMLRRLRRLRLRVPLVSNAQRLSQLVSDVCWRLVRRCC